MSNCHCYRYWKRSLGSFALILLSIGMLAFDTIGPAHSESDTTLFTQDKPNLVSFNQDFIEGLYSELDVDNTEQMFAYVFSSLGSTVTVYPTENYYYFSLNIEGKTIWGNLRLDVLDRDQGIIHFGFFEYDENGKVQDREGHEKAYSSKDGVKVKRVERFLYSVTYRKKTVLFRLNDVGMAAPQKAKLIDGEQFVGPIFDESGLKFSLIFNTITNHFIYLLNEDGVIAESFIPFDDDILIGRRTGFAFYLDEANNRKILIAVHGKNTDRNNYYDGPFDQLPDNYAEQTQIKRYIERAYPYLKGRVDIYGGFLDQQGSRALINPYFIYYDERELDMVHSCKALSLPLEDFQSCITPDSNQMGDIDEESEL